VNISGLDLTILIAYLFGVVAFGLWMGRNQKTAADFMVGSRNFPWWVILFSIVATETSTVTFLSIPGLAWATDLTFLQLPLGYIVGRLLVCMVLLPRYFKGEMFTAYEVLHVRFGGQVKRFASLLFIVTRTLGDGLRLFLSAIVLERVFSIDIEIAVICLGVATILYTFVGGMRAVLWTDLVQFVVYMGGAVIAFCILIGEIDGGFGTVNELATQTDKLRVFNFDFNFSQPYLFWTGLIGGAVFAVGTHGVDQMMVQRYLCARNLRDARKALAWSGPVVLLQFAFFLVVGVALYAFYQQNPQTFDKPDRVFATFIVSHLPIGVLGLVLGAVFSAAMSTLSSSLNSTATAIVNDVYVLPERETKDALRLRLARSFTIVFGVAQIAVGIGGQLVEGTPIIGMVLHIQGFTTGIILGVFFLATVTADSRAAIAGLVGGLVVVTFVEFGAPAIWPSFSLAWPWFVLVGSAATFAIGLGARSVLRWRGI
jgi:SSS family transporter